MHTTRPVTPHVLFNMKS